MADKTVGDLLEATTLNDDSLLVMEQNGEARKIKGKVIKDWVAPYAESAQNANAAAQSAYQGVKNALDNLPEGAVPVINDLTTGGASAALSAEQGKVLARNYYNLGLGTAIPSGANLDDYKTVGTYYSANSTITASLTNPPATGSGFCLIVEIGYQGAHRVQKVIFGVSGRKFIRYYQSGSWSAWQEAATTDYALARDGSNAMTGKLTVQAGAPQVKIASTTTERTLQQALWTDGTVDFINRLDANNDTVFRIRPETASLAQALQFYKHVDGTQYGSYNILHTGNKPNGSYTGNGDAASRTIDTGGVGKTAVVYTKTSVAFLTPWGGFGYVYGSSNITSAAMYFSDGIITLASASELVNTNGTTYYYQVL